MGNVDRHTLDIARMKYELLGQTLPQIQKDMGIPITVLEMAKKQEEWREQQGVVEIERVSPNDVDSLSEFAEILSESVLTKLSVLNSLKMDYVAEKYIELEVTLVNKAIQAAQKIDTEANAATTRLLQLTKMLKQLIENTLLGNVSNQVQQELAEKWQINVIQKFGTDSPQPTLVTPDTPEELPKLNDDGTITVQTSKMLN